jgi:transposase InsO family protein
MEEEWIVDRSKLRAVWLEHPDWSHQQMAKAVGRSKAWVKKWLRRIRNATLEDREVLHGRSRVPKKLPPCISDKVVNKVLEIRDHPPQQLGRVPGPLPILYYLKQDQTLVEQGLKLPRSTRTIWKILDRHHRIPRPWPPIAEPEERPAPGVEWGMDFHDVSTVPAEPDGKQQHIVEILNLVDHGSSAVVASEPASDYNAETALRKLAEILVEEGCPDRIRLDRDTRWVGSWTAKDFPSPLLRFLQCLGIEPRISPPQHPEKNPFVERYHRNFKYECQLLEKPTDLPGTVEVNQRYVRFYNYERPNQAITCGNQPPYVKFPEKPVLSTVPAKIDPDRWLLSLTGKTYKRKLDSKGCFQLGNQTYYVQQSRRGQVVVIWVDGQKRMLNVVANKAPIKSLAIKGLHNRSMKFEEYLDLMCMEAVSASRRAQRRTAGYG